MKTIIRTCLIILLIPFLLPSLLVRAATAMLNEASLGGASTPADIHVGLDGRVYIVDTEQVKLWRINSANSSYEQFDPGSGLYDAVDDGYGKIWYTDANDGFGYFDLTRTPVEQGTWKITGQSGSAPFLGPLAMVDGKLWMATWISVESDIFRYTPESGELCHYNIQSDSFATDLVPLDGRLWWLNWKSNLLISLSTSTGMLTSYQLNSGIEMRAGMLADQGTLWWADDALNGKLYRFNPANNQLTTFGLPDGTQPVKVSLYNERVWYSDASGSIGSLDPNVAPGTTTTLAPLYSIPIIPTLPCPTLGKPSTQNGTPTTGTLVWENASSTVSQPQAGIDEYTLPASNPAPSPLGIATVGQKIWITDDGRDKLVQLNFGYNIFIPYVHR